MAALACGRSRNRGADLPPIEQGKLWVAGGCGAALAVADAWLASLVETGRFEDPLSCSRCDSRVGDRAL